MKFFIVEESALKEKDSNDLILAQKIQQVEIPDEILEKARLEFEDWLKKKKEEDNGKG